MTPEDVKNYYGSTYRFQKSTGMNATTLHQWLRKGYIPLNAQASLQILTNGALIAEIKKPMEKEMTKRLLKELEELRAYKKEHEESLQQQGN
jgi:hypothetical protein